MLNGLDLFSGIGGLTLALSEWVNPITYCEIEPYAQGVLASRMSERRLPIAPIWDDVRTLSASVLPIKPDIIYGGFPCQDISVAGRGKGLAGERSGLYFEISRLVSELRPTFVFLENVPAIRSRGLDAVLKDLADQGYDLRWTDLSAAEVGANHKRNRWWLLGYSKHNGSFASQEQRGIDQAIQHDTQGQNQASQFEGTDTSRVLPSELNSNTSNDSWWSVEPNVDRVVNGLPHRVDRIKCLGNAVVPAQARQAFMMLSGINQPSGKE
jgi:DNA (cytosine-5)-methyltransferase 1